MVFLTPKFGANIFLLPFIEKTKMNAKIHFVALKTLLANQPNWDSFRPNSQWHQEWLGKVFAHLRRWNSVKAETFNFQVAFLSMPGSMKDSALTTIINMVNQAVFDLEMSVPAETQQIFGPGAVYDFFKELRELLMTAQKKILIVDPYLDAQIFDGYIGQVSSSVEVRMLTNKNGSDLKIAVDRFNHQNGTSIEIKKSNELHDRAIIIDNSVCWVLGQSIKDAAKSKQTYMVPVDSGFSKEKIDHYYSILGRASVLQ